MIVDLSNFFHLHFHSQDKTCTFRACPEEHPREQDKAPQSKQVFYRGVKETFYSTHLSSSWFVLILAYHANKGIFEVLKRFCSN